MSGASNFTFRLSAQGVDQLRKDLEALGTSGQTIFDRLKQAAPGLGDAMTAAQQRIAQTRQSLESLKTSTEGVTAAVSLLQKGLSLFGIGLGVQQIIAFGKSAVDLADRLQNTSQQLGIGVEQLQAFEYAARHAGVGADTVSAALSKLSLVQGQAVAGSKDAVTRFAALGIAFKDASGRARPLQDVIADLADRMHALPDAASQAAAASELMGKVGPRLANLLAQGSTALKQAYDDARNAGQVMTAETEARLAQAQQRWQDFGNRIVIISGEVLNAIEKFAHTENAAGAAADQIMAPERIDAARKRIAELTGEIGTLQAALKDSPGGILGDIYTKNTEAQLKDARAELAGLQKQLSALLEIGATSHGAQNPRAAQTSSFKFDASGTDQQKSALDALIASMQKDAELAGLSGKAHAEREAILNAEAAAQKDVENHLRNSAVLTDAEKAKVLASADAAYDRSAALKDATKATQDQTTAVASMLAGMAQDANLAKLSGKAHAELAAIMQVEAAAQRDYDKGLRDSPLASPQEVAQAKAYADAIQDAADNLNAQEKAQQAATRAADDESKKREQIAQQEAELQLEPYKNAIAGLQDAWTNGWEETLSGNVNSFSDFFDEVKQLGIKWAAEMASLMTFRPVASGVLGALGQDQLAASLGLQNVGGTGVAASQNAIASSSGLGGSLANLFSTQGASGGLGSLLFGTGGGLTHTGGPAASTAGLFGASPGMASFFNSGIGTGIVGAGLSAGITAASGGSSLQSMLAGGGSLIGGIAGSYFGPVGSMAGSAIGGVLGNLFGGLFGHKKKPPKLKSITDIDALSSGYFGVGNTYTHHIDDTTSSLGQSAASGINEYLASIGGQVSGPLSGSNTLDYYGRTPRFMSIVGGVNNQFGSDQQGAEDAVADFIARTIVAAAKENKLTGVSKDVATAIKNSGAADQTALQAAVDFGRFFDRLDQIRTPAQSATSALEDLTAQMQKAADQARQYGLDAAKIPAIFKANFVDGITTQIEQLKDPTQYALDQLAIEQAGVEAQAKQLGVSLVDIETLYGLKRQAIVEQGLEGVNSTFQDFFNGLLAGPLSALSPEAQYEQTRQQYETAKQSGDASAITAAAQTFLQASQGFNASTKDYAEDFREVVTDIKALGGITTPIPGFAGGGDFGGGYMMAGEDGPELIATGAARVYDAQTTAKIMAAANADLSPKTLANIVRSFGRGPDTKLVHMRPDELAYTITMFGVDQANPVDGLPEFLYGSGVSEGHDAAHTFGSGAFGGRSGSGGGGGGGQFDHRGNLVNPSVRNQLTGKVETAAQASANKASGKAGSDAAQDAAYNAAAAGEVGPTYNAINPGNPNLGLTGPDYSGPIGPGTGVDKDNPSNLSHAGGGGWDNHFGPAPTSPKTYDGFYDGSKVNTLNGPVDVDKFMTDWSDYQGLQYGDTPPDGFWDKVGNFLAGLVGINEVNPLTDPSYNTPTNPAGFGADWGWDPVKTALSIAGIFNPIAEGANLIYGGYKMAGGQAPYTANLGPSVFGSPDAALQGVDASQFGGGAVNDNSVGFSGGSDVSGISGSGIAPAGVLAAGGDARSLGGVSSVANSQNSIAATIGAGLTRTAKGSDAVVAELQALRKINQQMSNQLDRLQSTQDATNSYLKFQTVRGSRKIG